MNVKCDVEFVTRCACIKGALHAPCHDVTCTRKCDTILMPNEPERDLGLSKIRGQLSHGHGMVYFKPPGVWQGVSDVFMNNLKKCACQVKKTNKCLEDDSIVIMVVLTLLVCIRCPRGRREPCWRRGWSECVHASLVLCDKIFDSP